MQTTAFLLKEMAKKDYGSSYHSSTWKHALENLAIFLRIFLYSLSKFSSQTQTLLRNSWRSGPLAYCLQLLFNCSPKVWKAVLDKKVTGSVVPPSLHSN